MLTTSSDGHGCLVRSPSQLVGQASSLTSKAYNMEAAQASKLSQSLSDQG
jgi:hypothetical protein